MPGAEWEEKESKDGGSCLKKLLSRELEILMVGKVSVCCRGSKGSYFWSNFGLVGGWGKSELSRWVLPHMAYPGSISGGKGKNVCYPLERNKKIRRPITAGAGAKAIGSSIRVFPAKEGKSGDETGSLRFVRQRQTDRRGSKFWLRALDDRGQVEGGREHKNRNTGLDSKHKGWMSWRVKKQDG